MERYRDASECRRSWLDDVATTWRDAPNESCGAGYRVRTGDIKLGNLDGEGQDLEIPEAVTATKAAKTGFREAIRPESRPDSSNKLTPAIFRITDGGSALGTYRAGIFLALPERGFRPRVVGSRRFST
jgi:hypothetical protein